MAGAFFCLGAGLLAQQAAAPLPRGHVALAADGLFHHLTAQVATAPEAGSHGPVLKVRAKEIDRLAARGLVRLSLDSSWSVPKVGSVIQVMVRLKPISSMANPGGFDYKAYMAERGIHVRAYAGKGSGLKVLSQKGTGGGGFLVQRARARLGALFDELPYGPGRELLRALVLGQRGGMGTGLRQAFAQVGAAHLLAISGLHLGLVWGLGFVLLRYGLALWPRLALSWPLPKLAAAAALIPAGAYAALAGATTPTMRALIMLTALVTALSLDRAHRPSGALALAALVITIIWPGAPRSISFQLSFTAVACILLAAGPISNWVRRRTPGARWLAALAGWLAMSGLVGLSVWPLAVGAFHQLPLLMLPANAVLVPLVAFLSLPLALVGAAVGLVHAPAGLALWHLALWPAGAACSLASWAAALPGAVWYLAGPGRAAMLLLYASVLALAALGGKLRFWLGGGLALAAALAWLLGAMPPAPDGRLTVAVLDVDQGSSSVIRLPRGQVLVVDGGGWPGSDFDFGQRVVAPYLWSQGYDRLAALALSHSDPDHSSGLPFLLRWFNPAQLWINGEPPDDGPYGRLLALAKKLQTPVLTPGLLERVHEIGGAKLRLLWPPENPAQKLSPNNRSLWIGLGLGQAWVWLPGDSGPMVERAVIPRLPTGGHQLLLAPHHGGKGSCSTELLARLRPKVVAISAGTFNRYGMPRPEVLARIGAAGAREISTDRVGMITLSTGGGPWQVRGYLDAPRPRLGEQISP